MEGFSALSGGLSTATQATLRATNLRVVLREILSATEPLSRAGVASRTGMTRSTASRLVDELIAGRLVHEGIPQLSGPGRPGVPLEAARGTVGALGVQINSARVAVRLVDLSGAVVAEWEGEHPPQCEPEESLVVLRQGVGAVLDEAPKGLHLVGAALALPGMVDTDAHRLLHAPHLAWQELDLAVLAGELGLDVPWDVGSEAHYAARSVLEPRPGVVGPHRDFICLYGDVGLGAALVTDGVVRSDAHGFAGAIGHVPYRTDGPTCACGASGCLEMYAGPRALLERAGLPPGTDLADLAERAADGQAGNGQTADGQNADGQNAHERAADGQDSALEALSTAGTALGTVLSGAVNLVDASTIIMAGRLGQVASALRPALVAALSARAVAGDSDDYQVEAAVDSLPAVSGAAISMLRPVIDDPAGYLSGHSGERRLA